MIQVTKLGKWSTEQSSKRIYTQQIIHISHHAFITTESTS